MSSSPRGVTTEVLCNPHYSQQSLKTNVSNSMRSRNAFVDLERGVPMRSSVRILKRPLQILLRGVGIAAPPGSKPIRAAVSRETERVLNIASR